MHFNLAYVGVEPLFHLRRDFILALKYGLEDCGHTVNLAGTNIDSNAVNLIIGAYFLNPASVQKIISAKIKYVCVNTEIIANDMLNFKPEKTDFINGYLPFMQNSLGVIEVVSDNMLEHKRYGNNAALLRLGYHPKLEDITHRQPKDIDFYFFGSMSQYRQELIKELYGRSLRGFVDGSCPYFLRNDRIGRAKLHLNIKQQLYYAHVNSFRIFYLLTNRCAVISEPELDVPQHYMQFVHVTERNTFADDCAKLLENDLYQQLADDSYEKFKKIVMKDCVQQMLDELFSSPNG